MAYRHACQGCRREVTHGAPMASHQRACKAYQALQAQRQLEEDARLERVKATACPLCGAAPGRPCVERGTRWAIPYSHGERHIAERNGPQS